MEDYIPLIKLCKQAGLKKLSHVEALLHLRHDSPKPGCYLAANLNLTSKLEGLYKLHPNLFTHHKYDPPITMFRSGPIYNGIGLTGEGKLLAKEISSLSSSVLKKLREKEFSTLNEFEFFIHAHAGLKPNQFIYSEMGVSAGIARKILIKLPLIFDKVSIENGPMVRGIPLKFAVKLTVAGKLLAEEIDKDLAMSVSRRCDIWKANNSSWYVLLGDFEYADEERDCTAYGPFDSADEAESYVSDNFSNPGGQLVDDSGVDNPPENPTSPEGRSSYRRRF